jgi:DNA-binding Xre family transcriptional regulator
MVKEKKFNPVRFRGLMNPKIKAKGYKSVVDFSAQHGFRRNALARAMIGQVVPKRETLNAWCTALECTPQERAEIIASVYVDLGNEG